MAASSFQTPFLNIFIFEMTAEETDRFFFEQLKLWINTERSSEEAIVIPMITYHYAVGCE
ncbi:hypothetical protein RND59_06205 [Vibrio ruber]|uniref:hypothetical protein n=1 Tax=Vibrio ruber TaxID=184755 RepID=UPI00289347C4|nr:hypothetical protein [Vibrio ruber]WNJ96673.1 hypothetical protein RND59_06205 [Vibrio ruber]